MREYWLDPPEYQYPVCPVCGNECELFFFDSDNKICGCDCCVTSTDAAEYEAERYEAEKEKWADERDESVCQM